MRHARLKTLELVIKQRRLRWFGHVLRMDDDMIPKQAIFWEMSETSWGPGRPRKNWNDIIRQDLKSIRVAWEDAEHSTFDREAWCERVAQCVLILQVQVIDFYPYDRLIDWSVDWLLTHSSCPAVSISYSAPIKYHMQPCANRISSYRMVLFQSAARVCILLVITADASNISVSHSALCNWSNYRPVPTESPPAHTQWVNGFLNKLGRNKDSILMQSISAYARLIIRLSDLSPKTASIDSAVQLSVMYLREQNRFHGYLLNFICTPLPAWWGARVKHNEFNIFMP